MKQALTTEPSLGMSNVMLAYVVNRLTASIPGVKPGDLMGGVASARLDREIAAGHKARRSVTAQRGIYLK